MSDHDLGSSDRSGGRVCLHINWGLLRLYNPNMEGVQGDTLESGVVTMGDGSVRGAVLGRGRGYGG